MKRIKKSTLIPLALLAYLAFMAVVGFSYFQSGEYLFYFGVLGITLFIIVLLHFTLKKREKLQQKRNDNNKNNQR